MSSYNKKSAILQQLQHAIKRKINDKSKAKEQTSSKILQASIEKRTQMTGNKPVSREGRVISSFKTKENKPVLNETPLMSIHQPNTGMDVKLLGKKSQSRKWQKLLSLINYMLSSSDKAIKYISAANFQAQFAVKLFKSDKQNLINQLKTIDLQQLANEIKGSQKPSKDTVNKQLYNQLFDENIKLKKEIVLLEKEAECFHASNNLVSREMLLTEPANHSHSSQLNVSSLTNKLMTNSARTVENHDYERFVQELLEEKGFKKLEEIMIKQKKFQAMLMKCKQGDKKISELHQILTALSHQKHTTFCLSLKQSTQTQIQKHLSKPLEPQSQTSRSIIKIKQIHHEKQLLQNEIQNLKEQLQAVKNIDKIDKENMLLKKNHQMLYKGLNEILRMVDQQYLIVGQEQQDAQNNATMDRSNIISKIQQYISNKQAQLSQTKHHLTSIQQQNTDLTQRVSKLQNERQQLRESLLNHKHQTTDNLIQYKNEIQRLNNAINFLENSQSKNLATQQLNYQRKIAELERNLIELENTLQTTKESQKYTVKRVKDLQQQLFVKQKMLQDKKQLIQSNQQFQKRLKEKFQQQIKKQQAKSQQMQTHLSQTNQLLISLQQKLITTETYCKGLEHEITQSTNKLQMYQQKITSLSETIQDLQARLQLSISDRQASQQSHILMVQGLNQQMSQYRIQSLRLMDVVARLEKEIIEVKTMKNSQNDKLLEQKTLGILGLQKDIFMLRQQNSSLINERNNLIQQLYDINAIKQQMNSNILALKHHLSQLQMTNTTLLNDNKLLFIDKQQLQNHLRNLQDHLRNVQEKAKEKHERLEEQKKLLLNQVQGLARCLDQVKAQNLLLAGEKSSTESEKDRVMQELSTRLQQERQKTSLLNEQNHKLTAQINILDQQRATLLKTEQQLSRRANVLEQQLKLHLSKLSSSHKQNQSLIEALNKTQSQISLLQEKQSNKQHQISGLVDQLQIKERQFTQLKEKHQQLFEQKQSQVQTLKQALLNERRQLEDVIQKSNADVQRLNNECNGLMKELTTTQQSRELIQQQLVRRNNQNQQLTMEINHLKQQLSKTNLQINHLKQQLNQTKTSLTQSSTHQSQITQIHQELASKQHQLQTIHSHFIQLQQQNTQLTELNLTLQQQLTTTKSRHHQQQQQLKQLEQEYKQLDEELATSMGLFQEIKHSLEVEKQNAKLLNDLNEQMKLNHQGELMEVENRLEQERLKCMKLQRDIEDMSEQMNSVKSDRANCQLNNIQQYQTKIQHYSTELSNTHQLISSLNHNIAELTQQLSSLKHQQLSLKKQLTQKDTLISTLQKQSSNLLKQLNHVSQQLSRTSIDNNELRKQLLMGKQSFQELNRHNITIREQLQESNEKNESLQRKLTKVNTQVQSLKHQLQTIKSQPVQHPEPQPHPSIHQMKLQQYVVLLKKILQSTNIQFSDLKDETSLDVLLQKGCQRIVKMKRQMRDEESNRKKLQSQRGLLSCHDRLLVVNRDDVKIEAFNQEAPELETERHFNDEDHNDNNQEREMMGQVNLQQLPVTRLFESSTPQKQQPQSLNKTLTIQQSNNTHTAQQKSNQSHHSQQQNISDFGDIEQNNMSKSQISLTDQQQLKEQEQQFMISSAMGTEHNQQKQQIKQPLKSQREYKDQNNQNLQHNDQQQQGFDGQNDIDDFNDVQSQKMNESFVSQDGFNQSQSKNKEIELLHNVVVNNNSSGAQINKSSESQKLQDFENFDDFKQSQSLNASMLSQKAPEPQHKEQQHHLQASENIVPTLKPSQNPSKILDDLDGFADYTSQQMSSSMVSQKQQKAMDDLDGFADYASEKMNESMISHKEEDFEDGQGNPFSDRKNQQDKQEGGVLGGELGDFDDYQSEKMNDSVVSQTDL